MHARHDRQVVLFCAEETVRAQLISLDGLLDYDESDTEEATMELSLAAEALQEMLSRDYGDVILKALLKERCAWSGYCFVILSSLRGLVC